MTWAYGAVGAAADTTDSSTLNVPFPSGISAGDLVAMVCSTRSYCDIATPSGWTLIKGVGDGGTTPGQHALFGKIATGSESGTQAVTATGGDGGRFMGQMARFTGAPETLAGNVHATAYRETASGTEDIPLPASGLTITEDATLVIATGAARWVYDPQLGMPTGFTQLGVEEDSLHYMVQAWGYQIQTTATSIGSGLSFGTTSTETPATASLLVSLLASAATVKYLKLLTDSSAASDTGVAGTVFEAPTGGDIVGAAIGEFTGAAFEADLESGEAVLKVAVTEFGGSSLTTSDTPVALVRNTTYTTGLISGTVIEE